MTCNRRRLLTLCVFLACATASRASILRVKPDAPGPVHDGATWDTAFLKVQDAVDSAKPGDEVWVAAGTYRENVRILASTPVSLYGGFAGAESARSERAYGRDATILDGGWNGSVVTIWAANVTVDGFTITGGEGRMRTPDDPTFLEAQGSGVVCAGDGAVIGHNAIRNNSSNMDMGFEATGMGYYFGSGGGVACFGNGTTVVGNVIANNFSGGWHAYGFGAYPMSGRGAWGAGVLVYGDDTTLSGNTITGNTLSHIGAEPGGYDQEFRSLSLGGAGVACFGARASLERNVIANNEVTAIEYSVNSRGQTYTTGDGAGAGVAVYAPGARLTGNLVAHNSVTANSSGTGGGIYLGGTAEVSGNTIADNESLSPSGPVPSGGGVYAEDGGVLANNVIAYNTGGLGLGGAVTLSHNDVLPATYYPPTTPHPTDLALDPLFASRATGDYHLQPGSPCVDAGDDASVPAGAKDLDGRPRILGSHVDIGAYETPPAAGLADALRALALAGGLATPQPGEVSRLDVAGGDSAGVVDLRDALALLRRANGLAP